MKTLKVVTIVGTRPEIIRLSRLIPALDALTDHSLVFTGQNYDPKLSDVFFQGMDIRKPDYIISPPGGGSQEGFLGVLFSGVDAILKKVQPDGIVILGDTNSSLSAIVAEKLGIPVFHLEAGNRSFDSKVPEELNRKIVDHASTFNLAYTENARRNLLREGLHPNTIAVTGSPMAEVLSFYRSAIDSSRVLEAFDLRAGEYFVLSAHRQETVDDDVRLSCLFSAVEAISHRRELTCVVSTHPRTRGRLEAIGYNPSPRVILSDPLPFFDYIKLQTLACFVLSDSGTVSEESSLLGFPAVTVRDSMERQEAIESGVISTSGLIEADIETRISFALNKAHRLAHGEYASVDFSDRVLAFILSKIRSNQFRN